MKKLDKIHYNISKIASYNKPFNFVISEREAGKSTAIWLLVWKHFMKGHPTLVIRRRVIDVTEAYIMDTLKIYRKFVEGFDMDLIKFNKGDCKDGVVDIKYNGQILIRVIGLSKDLYALKGLILEDLDMIVFDEFICNQRLGEKYLKDEAFKFKELYNTFQRECEGTLRAFFMGNPYSLYNPYFAWIGVKTSDLRPGAFIVTKTYAIECYTLTEELREFILKKNPLYQFDDGYTKYAFNGLAINDMNIRVNEKDPDGYRLMFGFRIDNHFLGVFENTNYLDFDNLYYIKEIESISQRKNIYCFEFNDLLDRTALVSNLDRNNFGRLKDAFRKRKIVFNNIQCYYLLEEVYCNL